MKTILIIIGSLIMVNVAFALPIECRQTKTECKIRWDKGQDCLALEIPFYVTKYGIDDIQCTQKVMFDYEKSERIKAEKKKQIPDQAKIEVLKIATQKSDLVYDVKFDYATNTPVEPIITSESGFIPTGVLALIGGLIIAILAFLGIKKKIT